MVRLKNRYLLVNILYPELENGRESTNVPDVVTFNQPTTDAFTAGALLKGLRAEIADLFGDYGNGAVAESISGIQKFSYKLKSLLIDFPFPSQIPVSSNVDFHPPSFARTLQDRMGCALTDDFCPC
jgi:hypothetical protein